MACMTGPSSNRGTKAALSFLVMLRIPQARCVHRYFSCHVVLCISISILVKAQTRHLKILLNWSNFSKSITHRPVNRPRKLFKISSQNTRRCASRGLLHWSKKLESKVTFGSPRGWRTASKGMPLFEDFGRTMRPLRLITLL